MTQEEKIKKLLDDYYGNSRSDDTKEEIVTFIINYYEDISLIMEVKE